MFILILFYLGQWSISVDCILIFFLEGLLKVELNLFLASQFV